MAKIAELFLTPAYIAPEVRYNPLPLRPLLKWAGGKRWIVSHLTPLWEPHAHRRLVEPFCGGLAVTLGLMPERALLNDINEHLINFYHWVKKGIAVSTATRLIYDKDIYYHARERFNELVAQQKTSAQEAAALFYYLNRTGYNGLCRFNQKGEYNVPFGKYTTVNFTTNFSEYKKAFAGWEFLTIDFERIPTAAGDFIYADPPYDVEFTEYAAGGFSWEDLVRTATWLAKHKGPVVASNQATLRILNLYKNLGFTISIVDAPRLINCTGDRTKAQELIAFRNL